MGRFLKHVAQALLLAGFAALAVLVVDWGRVLALLKRLDTGLLALVLLLEWVFYGVESLRIHLLSRRSYPVGLILKTRLFSVFLGNILPGLAAAELTRVLLLDSHRPGRKIYLLLLLLANRLYGLISLAGLFLVAFLAQEVPLPPSIAPFIETIAAGCLAVLFFPLVFNWRRSRKTACWLVLRVKGPLRKPARTLYQAVLHFSSPPIWLIATASSIATSFIAVLEFWLIATALGIASTLLLWTVWTPLIALGTFLPIGFGAFGSQDAGFTVMSQVLGQSVEPFLVLSLVVHAARFLGSLPGVLALPQARKVLTETLSSPWLRGLLRLDSRKSG